MLSQWFEIIAITHSHKQLARLSSPTNRIQFFETRRNRHVSLTDNVLRKILRCPRTLFRPTSSDIIIRITTNAANYTTTRAELIAHVRNTTFINDHLLFFPPLPFCFETCHEQSLLSLSILLYAERKGYATGFNVSVEAELSVRGN